MASTGTLPATPSNPARPSGTAPQGACLQNDQTDLVAVCDVSQAALDSFTGQFQVERSYTLREEMLDGGVVETH